MISYVNSNYKYILLFQPNQIVHNKLHIYLSFNRRSSQLLLDVLRNVKPRLIRNELHDIRIFVSRRLHIEQCSTVELNLLMLVLC